MAEENGMAPTETSNIWSVCLDETKRYFVLRHSDNDQNGNRSILTIGRDQGEKTFKEMCEKFRCPIRTLNHIYCYGCDGLSHGICPDHPLVFVIDRPVKMEANTVQTLPNFLSLKPSTIPKGGTGVFTSIFLPAGSVFGPYGGFMIYGDDEDICNDYSWELETPKNAEMLSVDASDPNRSNFLRWINCARFKEQNMIVLQFHDRMYYVVFKPIEIDQELLVWYGDEYADRLGIDNLKRCTDLYAPPKAKRDPKAIANTWT